MIPSILQLVGSMTSLLIVAALFFVIYLIGASPLRRLPRRLDAEFRAERLLESQLSAEEYHQLLTQGYLRVQSPSAPHRSYLIPRYRGLVRVYEQGRSVMRLCVGPVEPIPDGANKSISFCFTDAVFGPGDNTMSRSAGVNKVVVLIWALLASVNAALTTAGFIARPLYANSMSSLDAVLTTEAAANVCGAQPLSTSPRFVLPIPFGTATVTGK